MDEILNLLRLATVVFTAVATVKLFQTDAVRGLSESLMAPLTGFFRWVGRFGAFFAGIVGVFSVGMMIFIGLGGTVILPDSIRFEGAASAKIASETQTSGDINWATVAPNVARWRAEIEEAASECGIDPALLAALVTQESGGNPNVCSSVGACGLAQLMPATAREMGVSDVYDPVANLRGGACYLKRQLDRYDGDVTLALAAYNAGAARVDQYGGVPPFAETQKYVRVVGANYERFKSLGQSDQCCRWPTTSGWISQYPKPSHLAFDIAVPLGTPIKAAQDGTVIVAGWSSAGYGKHVVIVSGQYKTLYAHLSSYTVKAGDVVEVGEIVGRSGNTGKSTGPHLHFEVYEKGILVNPSRFLPSPK